VAAPEELIRQVPLFSELDKKEMQGLTSSMKERTFKAGDTIAHEGQTGIGFFVIEDGEASVSVGGEERALIDDGARTATVTAKSDLRTYGITSWEFRPLIEQNASLAWKLLQQMAQRLRDAEQRTG
jgi:CRP-like cAMP-binding protein